MNDLTVIYYTANYAPEHFTGRTLLVLYKATAGIPIVSVSQKPMSLGTNICVGDIGRSTLNIYRQALIGAKEAKTKYIAMAEDDVLYSKEHFAHRPTASDKFAYNKNVWSIYTWTKPAVFSYKDRRVFHSLICERDLFVEAMEERFKKYSREQDYPPGFFTKIWGEPGKYEGPGHLNVTIREAEDFYSDVPNIAFSHETALSFGGLGTRKRLGYLKSLEIPYWGRAEDIQKYYEA